MGEPDIALRLLGSVRVGSIWCWEPLKPRVRATVQIVGTEWNGEEWWITTETIGTGERHRNEFTRFVEAAVLMKAAR